MCKLRLRTKLKTSQDEAINAADKQDKSIHIDQFTHNHVGHAGCTSVLSVLTK
jgi:hypothetical protein